MTDFNPLSFAAGSFLAVLGITAAVMASARSPASIIDEQRLIEHDIMRSKLARARAKVACRVVDAALIDLDASAALRRAAISKGLLQN